MSQIGKINNFICSHCGVLSQFNSMNQVHSTKESRMFEVSVCMNKDCGKFMIFVYDILSTGTNTMTIAKIYHYPTKSITVHQSIDDKDFKDSYIQGSSCLDAGSPIGAVTCFRRALQQICIDKNASQEKKLNGQIDEVIPDYLQDQAHEIRLWGNLGAHPDEIIKDVSNEDAEEIKDLLDSIFDSLYISPFRVQERRNKRNQTP